MTSKLLREQNELAEDGSQLNIAPARRGALWKVVVSGIKCPACGCAETKAKTGKRLNGEGLLEHYRQCLECEIRFRVVFE